MNIEQYQQELRKLTQGLQRYVVERVTYSAASEVLGNIKNRIQREGKDSLGATMPPYSTKPDYFVRDEFVKKSAFKPVGKRGFKGEYVVQSQKIRINRKTGVVSRGDVQNRIVKVTPKSMYLQNGYKEFREIQGRQTQKRDLTLSGETMLSYQIGVKGEDIVLGLTNKRAINIRSYQERINGNPIFPATQEEMNQYNKKILELYTEQYRQLINI